MSKKLILAVLVTLLIAVTGGSMAFAGADEEADSNGTKVIHLISKTVQEAELDLGEKGFGVGDRFVFSDDLYRDDEKVGQDGGECVVVRLEGPTTTVNCVVTLSLPKGQITSQGLASFTEGQDPQPFTVAITGGTGRYREADGEVTVEEVSQTETRLTVTLVP